MAATAVVAPRLIPGTRPGTHQPGALLLLCQCCRTYPKILAEAHQGKLTIEGRAHTARHYVVLGVDICDRMEEDGWIWCACCDPTTEPGVVLAEFRDGLLLIRARRHAKLHFVALTPQRVRRLLAPHEERA
jgi:hypothetical protein